LNVHEKKLQKIKELLSSSVTALAISPDNYAWAAMPGDIICFDPATGADHDIKPVPSISVLPPTKPAGPSDKVFACPANALRE
jgi:hypothetical protein